MIGYPSGQDGVILPTRGFWLGPARSKIICWCFIPYNKSFIAQVCSVKMAGYWPRSFFACLWTSTKNRTWPISSHLDRANLVNKAYMDLYIIPILKIQPPMNEGDISPTSLTSCLSKVLEDFVVTWLMEDRETFQQAPSSLFHYHIYYSYQEITGDPRNLIGSHKCEVKD